MDISEMTTANLHPSLLKSFTRAQVASAVATLADFVITILIKEVFHAWYVAATSAGALFGAITGFLLGRHWVFKSTRRSRHIQAFRYLVVAVGSLLLNSWGVYFLTESTGINYLYCKMIIGIAVGIGFNFVLYRKYVFV